MSTIKSLSVSLLSFLVIVPLAGCGSGVGSASSAGTHEVSGSGSAASTGNTEVSGSGSASSTGNTEVSGSGSVGVITPKGVATLSWAAPKNADGVPFTGIAGFKVYYGTSPGTYGNSINVGMTTSHSVNSLAPGTYYFAVTTCDSSGNESGFSNEASKTIL